MAGGRRTNTFAEGLPALMSMIQELKLAPDADIPWLIDMETRCIAKHQDQFGATDQVRQMLPGNAQPSPLEPPPGASMPTGVGGGMPMVGANTGVGGSRMPAPMPAGPNPDELRRLLTPGPQGG